MSKQINFLVEDSIYEDIRPRFIPEAPESVAAYIRDRVLKQTPVPSGPVPRGQLLAAITKAEFFTIVTSTETGKISLELILKFLREKRFLAPE